MKRMIDPESVIKVNKINNDEPINFISNGNINGSLESGGGIFSLYQKKASSGSHYGIAIQSAFGTRIGILPPSGSQPIAGFSIEPSTINIYSNRRVIGKITSSGITIGSTELTEDLLKKLIALIPAESAE